MGMVNLNAVLMTLVSCKWKERSTHVEPAQLVVPVVLLTFLLSLNGCPTDARSVVSIWPRLGLRDTPQHDGYIFQLEGYT